MSSDLEMFQDGVTGLSYDFDRPELLEATIRELIALPEEELAAMRRATLERARAYAPEAVFGEIARALTRPARSARTAGEAGPAKTPGPAVGPAALANLHLHKVQKLRVVHLVRLVHEHHQRRDVHLRERRSCS